jgi:hypothetical protein
MAVSNRPDRVLFGPPVRGKEASDRPARGRMCSHDGCETVLSTYNTSDVCWLHAPPAYRQPLSRD